MTHHGLNKLEVSLHSFLPLAMNHRNPLHRGCSAECEVYIHLFSLHMEGKTHNLGTGLSLLGSSELQKKQRTK